MEHWEEMCFSKPPSIQPHLVQLSGLLVTPPVIIVDFLSSEGPVTGEGYVGRISLDNSTGSLELRKLTIADSGEYRVILRESDLMYLSNTSLNVYGEYLLSSKRCHLMLKLSCQL